VVSFAGLCPQKRLAKAVPSSYRSNRRPNMLEDQG
jgi:hypothetical protein